MTNKEREQREWEDAVNLVKSPFEQAYETVRGYSCVDDCVLAERLGKNGETVTTQLSNFAPLITEEISRDNGVETQVDFTIEAEGQNGKRFPPVTIPASKFSGMGWVLERYGARANICAGNTKRDQLRYAIQAASTPKQRTVYSHMGWRNIDGRWCYLYNGGAIGADGVDVELEGNLSAYALPPVKAPDAVQTSADYLKVGALHVTAPLLATMYLTPLCAFCKGERPAFIPFVAGVTGTRKTTISALAMSHFGSFGNKQLTASFADTANSIMRKGFIVKDAPLLVDDYHPTTDFRSHENMKATAQRLSRAYGDIAERGRANPDGSIRQANPPRGLCIMSGEEAPEVGESGIARYYVIEMHAGDVEATDILTRMQDKAKQGYLWQAMRQYIERLSVEADTLPSRLHTLFVRHRSECGQRLQGVHGRIIEAVAWLFVSLDFMEEFFNDNGVAIPRIDVEAAIVKNAKNQADTMKGEKPVDMFLSLLRELHATGAVHIVDLDDNTNACVIGFCKNPHIYFHPRETFASVSDLLKRNGERFPLSSRETWRRLKDDGVIDDYTDGKHRTKRMLREVFENVEIHEVRI